MLERDPHPSKKDVMLICDKPVATEFNFDEKFSSMSNIALVTSLRTGMVNNYSKEPITSTYKGILESDVFLTYLDYEGPGEGNFDYCKEIRKGKDADFDFMQLPNHKDVWVSARLYAQLSALLDEIRVVQPRLVIVAEKWTLFLLTGCSTLSSNMGKVSDKKPLGCIDKFRASLMRVSECFGVAEHVLVPIMHTVHTVMMPDKVTVMELDIQKLGWMYNNIRELGVGYYLKPDKEYILGRDLSTVVLYLRGLLARLDLGKVKVSIDVETMFHSIIDCIGITDSIDSGLCIPFAHKGKANYWPIEEETEILIAVREVMLHPNCIHVGQNYSYDCQYFYKLWLLLITPGEDTMVLSHILYNYLPRNLAFLASRYCEHYKFWKDDIEAIEATPETRWIYNIKDVCSTLEVEEVLQGLLSTEDKKLQDLYRFQMDRLSPALIDTMNRGVKVDIALKEELYTFFSKMLHDITTGINSMLGVDFNLNSPVQKKKLFKDFLGMKLKTKKGADSETCDAAAMLEYIEEYPLYRPFLVLMLEHASLKVFTNNFLGMKLDTDNRARTQYRIAGTDTGRLASTKNVWGCMPTDMTYALTPGGWVSIAEKPAVIAQYTFSGDIEFVPATWNIYEHSGDMYYPTTGIEGMFTPNHRLIYTESGKYKEQIASHHVGLPWATEIPVSGNYRGRVAEATLVSDDWLRIEAMLSADGTVDSNDSWVVAVKKQRKVDRLLEITKNVEVRPRKSSSGYYTVALPDAGYSKVLPEWLMHLPLSQRVLFIEEVGNWDSHRRASHYIYYSTIEENARLLHTLCHISGYSAKLSSSPEKIDSRSGYLCKEVFRVTVSAKSRKLVIKNSWRKRSYIGQVGCPTVDSTMWLAKYDECVYVTGNSGANLQNIPSKGKLNIKYALELLSTHSEDTEDSIEEFITNMMLEVEEDSE